MRNIEQHSVVDIHNTLLFISGMDLPTFARKTGARPADFRDALAVHGMSVSKEIVRRWLLGLQQPGVKALAAIEAATAGAVTRHTLRPDVFGPAPRGSRKRAA